MPIQKVVKYQTEDGKEFDDRNKAFEHEKQLETETELEQILKVALNTGRADCMLRYIVQYAEQVRDILTAHIRKSNDRAKTKKQVEQVA